MRLVDYSSSEESEDEILSVTEQQATRTISGASLPALPSGFYDLYSVKPRVGDDPSLHEGRIRGQPHVVGQWPTHAYIECRTFAGRLTVVRPGSELHGLLQRVLDKAMSLRPQIKSLLLTEFGNVAPLHVSLSRPLLFWTHEKETFFESFTSGMSSLKLSDFEIEISDLECFINHESTRKFLVLRLKNSQELEALADIVDNVIISFERPRLYDSPVYHISIGWSDMTCEMDKELLDALHSRFKGQLAGIRIKVQSIKLKVGSEIHTISFLENAT